MPLDFGMVGAIVVENEHHKEMFIKSIELEGVPNGASNNVKISCNSWVHSKFDNAEKRIFFTNKVFIIIF